MSTAAPTKFEVSPPSVMAWVGMGLLGGALPLSVILVLWLTHQPMHGILPGIVVILLVCALLALAMRRRGVELHTGILEVRAAIYRIHISTAGFDLDRARIVNLGEHTELRPWLKTGGMAMPGFKAGHFRLRGGLAKAFCLLTQTDRVLWLPQRDGKSQLLLSLERPQALLDALHSAAA